MSRTILTVLLALAAAAAGVAQQPEPNREVTRLVSQLDDPQYQFEAMRRLAQAGSAAAPELRAAIAGRKGYARVLGARALRASAPEDAAAAAALAAAVNDPTEPREVRRYAMYTLALSPTSLPVVRDLLQRGDPFNRRSAAFALLELHAVRSSLPEPFAQPLSDTVPALIASLGSDDELVRGIAGECLEQIDGFDELLLQATRASDQRIRTAAERISARRRFPARIRGSKPLQLKPGALEAMRSDIGLLSGHLGIIYAREVGGEPVEDFRTIIKAVEQSDEALSVRTTVNPQTLVASTSLSRFNPYADLR